MFKLFKKESGKNLPDAAEKAHHDWQPTDFEEGQLSLDVYETEKNIIIKSTIAGVKPDDLDITIDNDMLTIRGQRRDEAEKEGRDYLYQECYWGSFSRSVILPVEVDSKKIDAALSNGVLTITLKKIKKARKVGVRIKN
ncbi:MAG TPA: Hsp20/alpha crystallin family protein [Candidatus Nanoarchaeia archaeon]|nr:Hsp20/alpha crystallin family protein [Candidatus Nanoarchaeia archaeon]